MRWLILSDIHANFPALEAVIQDATTRGHDAVAFLGDVVGYGPHPVECLESLASLNAVSVLGNHDTWLLDLARGRQASDASAVAQALAWQLERLEDYHLMHLEAWAMQEQLPFFQSGGLPSEALLIHGSPRDPVEYTDSLAVARDSFEAWTGRLSFVGHTHKPVVFATLEGPSGDWTKSHALREPQTRMMIAPRARWIANPGSVGQPRDGDPRASYGLYDAARGVFQVFRVAYDVLGVQRDIRAACLAEPFATRLEVGR